MIDWESLRHLAALARARTLAGAARALNVEHATVARRIASLERALQLKLLDRRGRTIELTRQARELIASLDRMQAEAEAIERLAAGQRTTLSGEVTISAPPGLAVAMLGPTMVAVRRRYPGLVLQLLAETHHSELQRREADLAIRLGAPIGRDLTANRIGEVTFRLYASDSYLATIRPAEWVFIAYDTAMDASPQQRALTRMAAGRPVMMRTNSVELQVSLVREGGGIAMLPDFLTVGEPIVPAGGGVVRREAWLVIHADMMKSAAVKAVADILSEELRKRLDQPETRAQGTARATR